MVDYGTGSFTLANLGNPATGPDDVFQWNPGDSAHRNPGNIYVSYNSNSAAPEVPEFVDDVVGGGRSTGTSILEFAVENHPNNPSHSPGDEGPEESIAFVYGKLGSGNDDGWCMVQTIGPVESDYSGTHLLYQDVFLPAVQGVGTPTDTDWLLV
jgi:hypothetical protein